MKRQPFLVHKHLPDFFKPLLWSYNFPAINPEQQKETVILQAINYGTLTHWRWIVRYYGKNRVRQCLMAIPATAIRPRVVKLVSLVFNLKNLNHAPRSAK